jgi:hypothetical protein
MMNASFFMCIVGRCETSLNMIVSQPDAVQRDAATGEKPRGQFKEGQGTDGSLSQLPPSETCERHKIVKTGKSSARR